MFKTFTIYQLTQATNAVVERLEKALAENRFADCLKHFQKSVGFVPPLGGVTTDMVYETSGGVLFCLRTDEKMVPAGYVKERVCAVAAARTENGDDFSVVDERLIKQEIIDNLLPGIPPAPSRTLAYIDKQLGLLVLDAGGNDADDFMSTLSGALKSTPFTLLGVQIEPCDAFTDWLRDPLSLGAHLQLGDNCSLKHPQEGGTAIINIQHDDLTSDELHAMLDAGKICCRIGLQNADASFALNAKLGIRRLMLSEERRAEIGGDDIPGEFVVVMNVIRSILASLEPLLGVFPKQELLDLHDEQSEEHVE